MPASESDALIRFRKSMVMDFDKWHDGLPYDIDALTQITRVEADQLTNELVAKSSLDWRDVEALRALATPKALARVGVAAKDQHDDGGVSALAHEIETENLTPEREKRLCELLERALVMSMSLDVLYDLAAANTTPAVMAQVFRGARVAGDEATRYSFGAFLLYLNGYTDDWYGFEGDLRPHLLDLNSADYKTYKAAVAWLQEKVDNPKARMGS
ncbi:MAG: hypothetical protein ABI740_09365 [Alphaproteobacteria bacterium]